MNVFIKWALFVLSLAAHQAFADGPSVNELAEAVRDAATSNETSAEMKQEISQLLREAGAREAYEDVSWLAPTEEQWTGGNEGARELIDSLAESAGLGAMSYLDRASAAVGQDRPDQAGTPKTGEPLFVLITLGMGDEAVLNYIREAEPMELPVILVLRGFDPDEGGMQAMVEEILRINAEEIEFEMHINPSMFRQTGADRGPVFLRRGEDGVTRVRRGAVNIHAALESMEYDDLDLVIGETFEIEEPDLLTIIETRVAEFDRGPEILEAAVARARTGRFDGSAQLPESSEIISYLVDPSVTINRDIRLPTGEIVVERGERVNPLETAPWDMQVVIFDAMSDWQVQQAKQWAQESRQHTIFIATRLPQDEEQRHALGSALKAHVNLLDDLVVRRMDLRAVPSRVRQEGAMVRVDTAAPGDEL